MGRSICRIGVPPRLNSDHATGVRLTGSADTLGIILRHLGNVIVNDAKPNRRRARAATSVATKIMVLPDLSRPLPAAIANGRRGCVLTCIPASRECGPSSRSRFVQVNTRTVVFFQEDPSKRPIFVPATDIISRWLPYLSSPG
jgi:hypothetical protein